MSGIEYTTGLLNRDVDDTEQLLYDLGCDPAADPVAAATEIAGEDVVYHHMGEGESTDARDQWIDPDSGVAAFVDTDGAAQEYWVVGADEHHLLVADDAGYHHVNMAGDRPQVEQFAGADGAWLEGPDYQDSDHRVYPGVFEDLYDLVTTGETEDIGEAQDTTGLRLQCHQAGDLTRYEQELELLKQQGEIVFDGRFSQHHNGKRRGGAVAEGLKQAFERKKLVDDVGYDIEMDSSGQHARLRITDHEG